MHGNSREFGRIVTIDLLGIATGVPFYAAYAGLHRSVPEHLFYSQNLLPAPFQELVQNSLLFESMSTASGKTHYVLAALYRLAGVGAFLGGPSSRASTTTAKKYGAALAHS